MLGTPRQNALWCRRKKGDTKGSTERCSCVMREAFCTSVFSRHWYLPCGFTTPNIRSLAKPYESCCVYKCSWPLDSLSLLDYLLVGRILINSWLTLWPLAMFNILVVYRSVSSLRHSSWGHPWVHYSLPWSYGRIHSSRRVISCWKPGSIDQRRGIGWAQPTSDRTLSFSKPKCLSRFAAPRMASPRQKSEDQQATSNPCKEETFNTVIDHLNHHAALLFS